MIPSNQINNIQLFKSVFAGREDVFAVRWENNLFKIDDYYMGQDIYDKDPPMPD